MDVSKDPNNLAEVGSDGLIYVPGDKVTTMQVVEIPGASTTWVVDIGRRISAVVVFDSQNPPREIWPGEVFHDPNSTAVLLTFSAPVSGKVHCHF